MYEDNHNPLRNFKKSLIFKFTRKKTSCEPLKNYCKLLITLIWPTELTLYHIIRCSLCCMIWTALECPLLLRNEWLSPHNWEETGYTNLKTVRLASLYVGYVGVHFLIVKSKTTLMDHGKCEICTNCIKMKLGIKCLYSSDLLS